ncbi:MAG: hypothetical protein HUU35_05140, partial [Armatimonadetes bacterium]|nr:hypothetical protein [Armatimonadota bacterium]
MRWRCGLWVLAVSGAVAAGPVETLRQRLDNGLPVTVVFMGDSISTGMHLEDPGQDGFPALFMQLLRHRYPDASLAASLVAQAGAPTATGLALFEARVRPLNPNLVVLQYGGNDKGTDDGLDNLPGYEANLRELVTSSRALGAAVLLVAPPMHEPVLDMPFPAAARR